MSLPKIIRKGGPYKTRFGIRIEDLKPFQRKILYDHPLLSVSARDDQFLLILFRLADMDISKKTNRKIYYNHYADTITEYDQLLTDSNYIDWTCAICNDAIKSEMSEFNIDNLLCNTCKETHGSINKSTTVDSRIVEHSIKFRKFCRSFLMKQQKSFIKYVNKFENSIKINIQH